ncbi:MAG: hypothetical protein J6Y53_03165 [Alphaproteobacteria bacterium]|nr:hypothetical protein [Alphaproteobacteria bacterium]
MKRIAKLVRREVDLFLEEQKKLLLSGNAELIKKFANYSSFSEEAEMELLNSGKIDLIKIYFDCSRISAKAQIKMLEHENVSVVDEYISRHNLCEEAEMMLIDWGNDDLLKKYIYLYRFCIKNERHFFETGKKDLMLDYLKTHKNTHCDDIIFDLNDDDLLIECTKNSVTPLPEKLQLKMVNECNKSLIERYSKVKTFGFAAENQLLENGNGELITIYAKNCGFRFEETQIKLLHTGYREIIRLQIMKTSFRGKADVAFVKLCDKELVYLYLQKFELTHHAWQLFWTKNLIQS